MGCLPPHGRVDCMACYAGEAVAFDRTKREAGDWRITANPLAWGSTNPAVVVLGFSKGPTQADALEHIRHEEIAYKGARVWVGKILSHVGLLRPGSRQDQEQQVNALIADPNGLFHFGSLIRCTVERNDPAKGWTGTGGDMLGRFMATPLGAEVAGNCAGRFLSELPLSVRLVVLFGLGSGMSYVQAARKLIGKARSGHMRTVNEVAYEDEGVVVVHVEHFRSQGNLIPKWLGEGEHSRDSRSRLGRQAREAVDRALSR